MRVSSLALAIMAVLSGCSSLSPRNGIDDRSAAVAEVRQLEERWTAAFNARDARFMEQVMAPEFVLVSSGGPGGAVFTHRADWMRVWLGPVQTPYDAKVVDVVVAGDTAVATIEAQWRRNSVLTDTWMKRSGRWQLVFRHSALRN